MVSWLAQFSMFLSKNSVGRGQSGLHIGTCDHFQHCHHRDLCPASTLNPPALPWHGGRNYWAICLSSVVWILDEGDGESDRNHCDPQISLKPVLSAHCPSSPQNTTNKIANRSFLLLKPGILPHKSNKSNPLSQPLLETVLCIFFILRRFGH